MSTRNGHLGHPASSGWQWCSTGGCPHSGRRKQLNRHSGATVPHGCGGCRTVRPQSQLISVKMASGQLAQAPRWHICWQLWLPHFRARLQVRMQICSASTAVSGAVFRFRRRAACLSAALFSPVQQTSVHLWRPQLMLAPHVLAHVGRLSSR